MTIRDFRNIIFLILLSILITTIIPGLISSAGGTFYLHDIKTKISQSQIDKINIYEQQVSALDGRIKHIDTVLNSILSANKLTANASVEELLKLKEKYQNEKQGLKQPIGLIPYYLNPQMLLWLGIYAAFFLLIYLLLKEEHVKLRFSKRLWGLSFIIYIFYEWPLWVRNFVLSGKGRTVYAYPNFDIDKYSFFYQEFIIYSFCLLATILITISLQVMDKKMAAETESTDTNKFLIISSYYSTAYRNWFIHSVILALGFLSFTGFFWRLVFDYGDQRYIISALNAHVIWALCWIAISLNLLKHMQQFEKCKRDILRNNPDDKTLKIVMEHQPANNLSIIVSGFASLGTFLLPLLKSFLH